MCCYNLELQLERELDGSRAADLVERVEAAELTAAAEVVVQHLTRITERRGALGSKVVRWIPEVRVVQDVEEIAAELKRKSFRESELAAQRNVPLRGAETAKGVASEIALCRGGHGRG